jgi:hypothetical protein
MAKALGVGTSVVQRGVLETDRVRLPARRPNQLSQMLFAQRHPLRYKDPLVNVRN